MVAFQTKLLQKKASRSTAKTRNAKLTVRKSCVAFHIIIFFVSVIHTIDETDPVHQTSRASPISF